MRTYKGKGKKGEFEMKIVFLGTGEAFGKRANTSILIDDKILLDCGNHTLMQLRKIGLNLNRIELVYISHLHADHTFGLPSLFLSSKEERRNKEIEIIAPAGIKDHIDRILDLSYKKKVDDFKFKIGMREIGEGDKIDFKGYEFTFAETVHSIDSFAVSVKTDNKLTYTSDGAHSDGVVELAKDSDLLTCEAYMEGIPGHSSILSAAKLARSSNSRMLALVHVFRGVDASREVEKAEEIFKPILLPQDLDMMWV